MDHEELLSGWVHSDNIEVPVAVRTARETTTAAVVLRKLFATKEKGKAVLFVNGLSLASEPGRGMTNYISNFEDGAPWRLLSDQLPAFYHDGIGWGLGRDFYSHNLPQARVLANQQYDLTMAL